MDNFGERLKHKRTQKGFSQSELAKLVGIHYSQIGRYESKGATPSSSVLTKLAESLAVSTDYLMNGTTNEQALNILEDKDLLSQFKKLEGLPLEKKNIVKELIDAFLLKNEMQKKFAS
jgi:transcriptional regulator with XRE-family HTH domain